VKTDYTGKSPHEFALIHPHKAEASKVFSTLIAQYSPIFIGEDNDIKYMMKDGHQVILLISLPFFFFSLRNLTPRFQSYQRWSNKPSLIS